MKIVCAPVGPLQANCYLVSDDEGVTCVIDPGGEAERLVEVAEKRGLILTQILLTHGHFDHMGGAAELAQLTGAPIGCSPDMAPMLRDPDRYIPSPVLKVPRGGNWIAHFARTMSWRWVICASSPSRPPATRRGM